MRSTWLALLLGAMTLAGCGQTPTMTAARAGAPAFHSQGSRSLDASDSAVKAAVDPKVRQLFKAVFDRFDVDHDGVWKNTDFELPQDRFLNLFHNLDSDDDRAVTWAEYYPSVRHDDEVLEAVIRGRVSVQSVGSAVTLDKALFFLDPYLQNYLNQRDRRSFIKTAFATADADGDKALSTSEGATAIAILRAKAEEKGIEKRVNRSKGQPE